MYLVLYIIEIALRFLRVFNDYSELLCLAASELIFVIELVLRIFELALHRVAAFFEPCPLAGQSLAPVADRALLSTQFGALALDSASLLSERGYLVFLLLSLGAK